MNKSLLNMLESASRKKPVTRTRIMSVFGVSDRSARHMIEQLRDVGYPVIGTSDHEGYWMATDGVELERFLRNYTAKANTINKRARKMRAGFCEEK